MTMTATTPATDAPARRSLCPPLQVGRFERTCRHCLRTVDVEHFVIFDEDRVEGVASSLLYCEQCGDGLETLWVCTGFDWDTLYQEPLKCRSWEDQQALIQRIEEKRTA